ncbi:MAG: acyltransferase [Lachnospiraceae bacterium]|nr:acyltransferase [Lachnospiraceae bacterium]
MNSTKHVPYFDLARGMAILLVVLVHVEALGTNFRIYLVSFVLPVFFLVSGMLLSKTGSIKGDIFIFIKKRFGGIMVPYYLYSLLYLVVEYIYNRCNGSLADWPWKQNLTDSLTLYGISVLWFLPVLFFGEILMALLFQFCHERRILHIPISAICIILLAGISYFFSLKIPANVHIWVMIFRIFLCLPFIGMGYYLYPRFQAWHFTLRKELFLGVVLLVITLPLSQINGSVDVHSLLVSNVLLFYLSAFTGTLGVLFCCRLLEKIQYKAFIGKLIFYFLEFFGKNSLTVMVTHVDFYLLYASTLIAISFIDYVKHAKSYIFCASVWCMILLMELPIIWIVNHWLPLLTGKRKH